MSFALALKEYQSHWLRLDVDRKPFVHSDDNPHFAKRKNSRVYDSDFARFVKSKNLYSKTATKLLHTALLPQPHLGDIENARVVILLKNPGFSLSDYWAEEHSEEFRKALRKALAGSSRSKRFPFLFLDPSFCWHGGFKWWEGKLRPVIREIADMQFDGVYAEGLSRVSKCVAAIEALPYHSQNGFDDALVQSLPSFLKAKSLAHACAKAGKTVIVARCAQLWDLKAAKKVIVYSGGQARGASFSLNSTGGNAIYRACLRPD